MRHAKTIFLYINYNWKKNILIIMINYRPVCSMHTHIVYHATHFTTAVNIPTTRTMNERRVWNVSYFLSYSLIQQLQVPKISTPDDRNSRRAKGRPGPRRDSLSFSHLFWYSISTHIIVVVVAYLCNIPTIILYVSFTKMLAT